jgi:hypothetical protein
MSTEKKEMDDIKPRFEQYRKLGKLPKDVKDAILNGRHYLMTLLYELQTDELRFILPNSGNIAPSESIQRGPLDWIIIYNTKENLQKLYQDYSNLFTTNKTMILRSSNLHLTHYVSPQNFLRDILMKNKNLK